MTERLNETATERNGPEGKPRWRFSVATDGEKMKKLGTLIRIIGNAGLEESGEEPDLTDKKVMRAIRPVELADIKCAVSEAVTNCIVHAYPNGIGIIAMRCRILKDNVLDIVIKDKGIGIPDTEQARRPMFTTGGADRSGMGFTVMESFMDEMDVAENLGGGLRVKLVKNFEKKAKLAVGE